MNRKTIPILNDDLGSYWRRANGKFLNGWYLKAKNYIEKNMPNDLFLEWKDGQYIVSIK